MIPPSTPKPGACFAWPLAGTVARWRFGPRAAEQRHSYVPEHNGSELRHPSSTPKQPFITLGRSSAVFLFGVPGSVLLLTPRSFPPHPSSGAGASLRRRSVEPKVGSRRVGSPAAARRAPSPTLPLAAPPLRRRDNAATAPCRRLECVANAAPLLRNGLLLLLTLFPSRFPRTFGPFLSPDPLGSTLQMRSPPLPLVGGARDLRETAVGVTQCLYGSIRPVSAANVDASSPLGRSAHLH